MKKLLILLQLSAVIIFMSACGGTKEEKVEKELRYVKSITVHPADAAQHFNYFGTVAESRLVNISFRTGGRLDQMNISEGDYLKEGEIIARIDSRDHNLQLKAAKAQFEQSKDEYARYKQLYERKKLPENTLQKMEAAFLMTESNYETAQNALKDCILKAPFSGYVFESFVENHEAVAPGQPIISLLDMNTVEIIFHIPEEHMEQMDNIASITFDIAHANIKNRSAALKSISEKAGKDNLFEVRLLADNKDNRIKSGMTATISLELNEGGEQCMIIPSEAVFQNNNQSYVWVIQDDNRLKKQQVRIGKAHNNGSISILKGLKNGAHIVTAGTHFVIEGQEVKIADKN